MKKEDNIWHDNPAQSTDEKSRGLAARFNHWFDHFFSLDVPDYVEVRTYAPPYEILETDTHYLMCLDLPGTSKDEITVEVVGNELIISGERTNPVATGSTAAIKTRRRYGRFRRAFTLPSSIDEDHIRANCAHGVLEIAIPKRTDQRQQRIPVGDNPEPLSRRLRLGATRGAEPAEVGVSSFENRPVANELELGELPSGDKAA